MSGDLSTLSPHVRSGRMRALAVTAARRSSLMPEVPTVAESGVPGYEATGWFGVLVPAGTSKEIVNRLHADITKVLKAPDVQKRFATEGGDIVADTPEQFAAFVKAGLIKWAKVVKESGAKVE